MAKIEEIPLALCGATAKLVLSPYEKGIFTNARRIAEACSALVRLCGCDPEPNRPVLDDLASLRRALDAVTCGEFLLYQGSPLIYESKNE